MKWTIGRITCKVAEVFNSLLFLVPVWNLGYWKINLSEPIWTPLKILIVSGFYSDLASICGNLSFPLPSISPFLKLHHLPSVLACREHPKLSGIMPVGPLRNTIISPFEMKYFLCLLFLWVFCINIISH